MNSFSKVEGEVKYFEINICPTEVLDEPYLFIMVNDATKREIIGKLKESIEEKSKIMANVVHELRTPLNGVIALLDMLKTKIPTELNNRFLKPASSSAHLLMNLINDILDMS